jgi:hypothetical protein
MRGGGANWPSAGAARRVSVIRRRCSADFNQRALSMCLVFNLLQRKICCNGVQLTRALSMRLI